MCFQNVIPGTLCHHLKFLCLLLAMVILHRYIRSKYHSYYFTCDLEKQDIGINFLLSGLTLFCDNGQMGETLPSGEFLL